MDEPKVISVTEALATLTKDERDMLKLRYACLGTSGKALTELEIAAIYNTSYVGVSQILSSGIKKLRGIAANSGPAGRDIRIMLVRSGIGWGH